MELNSLLRAGSKIDLSEYCPAPKLLIVDGKPWQLSAPFTRCRTIQLSAMPPAIWVYRQNAPELYAMRLLTIRVLQGLNRWWKTCRERVSVTLTESFGHAGRNFADRCPESLPPLTPAVHITRILPLGTNANQYADGEADQARGCRYQRRPEHCLTISRHVIRTSRCAATSPTFQPGQGWRSPRSIQQNRPVLQRGPGIPLEEP